MAKIELINICKTFGERRSSPFTIPLAGRATETAGRRGRGPFSIHNFNLTIPHSKTMVVLGPSGCGKSTLLRIIAGLIPPDSGEIRYNGVNMNDVPPGERRIGMLFQSYALYPHMTSKTNILSYFLYAHNLVRRRKTTRRARSLHHARSRALFAR